MLRKHYSENVSRLLIKDIHVAISTFHFITNDKGVIINKKKKFDQVILLCNDHKWKVDRFP